MDPRVSMVLDVANLVASDGRPYDELLDLAAEIICQATGDLCTIALLSDDRRELHPLGLHLGDQAMQRKLETADRLAWASFGGVSEQVLTSGDPAVFAPADLERAKLDPAWVKTFLDRASVHSAAAVAMRASGAHIGVLAVARQIGSPALHEDDIPYLQAVADRLGLAIENLRLKEELARLSQSPDAPLPDPRLAQLTGRELDVLALIGEGLTNREISDRLFLSIRTIEWHRARLSGKLDIHERSELIAIGRALAS